MSDRNVFALPLKNTSLCCNYGYGKKKCEILPTLTNKAIPSCEIRNNDKNTLSKMEVNGRKMVEKVN